MRNTLNIWIDTLKTFIPVPYENILISLAKFCENNKDGELKTLLPFIDEILQKELYTVNVISTKINLYRGEIEYHTDTNDIITTKTITGGKIAERIEELCIFLETFKGDQSLLEKNIQIIYRKEKIRNILNEEES